MLAVENRSMFDSTSRSKPFGCPAISCSAGGGSLELVTLIQLSVDAPAAFRKKKTIDSLCPVAKSARAARATVCGSKNGMQASFGASKNHGGFQEVAPAADHAV